MQNKHRIYIDEVGNPDLRSSENPNHRFLSLTGVIFDLNYISNTVHKEIELFKTNYFGSHPDDPVIFHRKEIINKKYPFQILKNPKVEAAFNKEFLSFLQRWEYVVISVLIDKQEHQQRYSAWRYDPYHYCMEIIIERYYRFLKDGNAVGDVLVESRGGKEDSRLKKAYNRIFKEGTSYIKAEELNLVFTSKQLKVKQKSMNISGLQIADLLAFPARQYMLKYYQKIEVKRPTFNDEIIEILKTKLYRRGNKTEGYGIKLLP